MPSRLPVESDFSNTSLSIIPPTASKEPINVLVLLHGLGDTKKSFKTLGKQLALPETACIALQGPSLVPLSTGGAHWRDDLIFDSSTGELDLDTSFKNATDTVVRRVLQPLIEQCQYRSQDIYLFGFGQGGMAALAASAVLPESQKLGGLISIGGSLPTECPYLFRRTKHRYLFLVAPRNLSLPRLLLVETERYLNTWSTKPGPALATRCRKTAKRCTQS